MERAANALRSGFALLPVSALGVLWGSAVGAVTLTLSSDKPTYTVGETVVLTVVGDPGGPSGASTFGIFVKLLYDAALTEGVSGSQIPHQTMGIPWNAGFAGIVADGEATLLDQVFPLTPGTVDPGNVTIGTATLVAEAAGVVDVSYFVQPGNTLTLQYFGITSLPGISFLIVPEPASAGLLLLGLALAAARRRTQRSAR